MLPVDSAQKFLDLVGIPGKPGVCPGKAGQFMGIPVDGTGPALEGPARLEERLDCCQRLHGTTSTTGSARGNEMRSLPLSVLKLYPRPNWGASA